MEFQHDIDMKVKTTNRSSVVRSNQKLPQSLSHIEANMICEPNIYNQMRHVDLVHTQSQLRVDYQRR